MPKSTQEIIKGISDKELNNIKLKAVKEANKIQSNMIKSTREILESLDKEFPDLLTIEYTDGKKEKMEPMYSNLKQFLSNALILQEQEIRKEERERCLKCVPEEKHQTGSLGYQGLMMGIVSFEAPDEKGWNACRQQFLDNINNSSLS